MHKNLSTAYTDLSALLSTLKLEGFSGSIEMEFPETQGILFIDSGEIINAEATTGEESKRRVGQEAVRILLGLSNQKDGVLSIYRLLPEQVVLVANNLRHEILFKGFSTSFIRLDRLLHKLQEGRHNGFIEVMTKEHQPMGVLFLEGGEPVEMFTIPKSDPSVFGRISIPIFVENTSKQGAVFDVYRRESKVPKEEEITPEGGEGLKELIPVFQEILSRVEKVVDGVSQKGTFIRAFKRVLIDKAETFDFLDPFGGEFEYREGTIRFSGEAREKDFAKGMVEGLHATLLLLEKELPKEKMLPLKLKAEIVSSLEPHSEAIKRLGVDTLLSSFF